jgi:tetratricopeptide (TPR) repeat protein
MVDAVKDELRLAAKSEFHRYRKAAVEEMGRVLISLLNPALRLESPPQPPAKLWEREGPATLCTRSLADGKTVVITGASGVGKTALASEIARTWEQSPVFWATVRPGLNDQPDSLIFELAYFLNRCDKPMLWSQLLAQSGKVSIKTALGIIRKLLAEINERQPAPLFCFDEVDRLETADNSAHHQVMSLIGALHEFAPLLLVGSQTEIKEVVLCQLQPLSAEAVEALLQTTETLSPTDRQAIAHHTHGNPRLIELSNAFCQYRQEAPTPSLQQILVTAQADRYLLEQIWPRLSPNERTILTELAVYRGTAPADEWQGGKRASALRKLAERALVHFDETGGVALSPDHRTVIYSQILSDLSRRALHRQAATVCQMRGLYTEAAYHLVHAGDASNAILQWRDHKESQINQGQASTALTIFQEIRATQMELTEVAQRWLKSYFSELAYLRGDIDQALQELDPLLSSESVLGVQAHNLVGVIENDHSNFAAAEAAFDQALKSAANLIGVQMAHIHKGLAWMHMRSRDLDKAWHEACLARAEAENIQGYVQELDCRYDAAEQHYLSALRLAEEINYLQGIAKICANLLGMYARRGQSELAKRYLRQAEECTRQIGKLPDLPGMKINEAFIHNLAGEYAVAVNALTDALRLYSHLKLTLEAWPEALIHQGFAEAYLGLGDLDSAEEHVRYAINLKQKDIEPDALRTLGEVMLGRGHLPEAEQCIQEALELVRDSDPYLAAYALRAFARVYLAMNDIARASGARNEAITTFRDINLPNEVDKTLRINTPSKA